MVCTQSTPEKQRQRFLSSTRIQQRIFYVFFKGKIQFIFSVLWLFQEFPPQYLRSVFFNSSIFIGLLILMLVGFIWLKISLSLFLARFIFTLALPSEIPICSAICFPEKIFQIIEYKSLINRIKLMDSFVHFSQALFFTIIIIFRIMSWLEKSS